ncbi:low affinity immunoglobulin gamma Fc region receptor II-b [Sarcophilus harrisii]|uniref:Fc gamma receptor IIb n=1 Tax=Sarcophilus harrisii TaxID=9305 RepID=G3VMN8_SARHA|nr:low affinity immunoglobulin gamma Fc region receptor II-b [Sarcophilus harrisii]
MGGLWVPQPFITTNSVLLWVALLCLAPAIRSNGPPQAILTLEPPWFNVLRDDNVTLTCEGFQTPGQDSIEWFHNGTVFPNHKDSYTIPAVSFTDSGHYQCRTKQTALSNSVKLQVFNDWVLLQVERLEFNEGESMTLKCHSWKNKPLHKVIYYHNNKALKYEYESFNYVVSQVNYTHSGTYFCTGFIGHFSHPSAVVIINVHGGASSTTKVVIIVSVLLIVIAIIAAALLYYYKYKKPANTPLELGKTEVENSMSYSLLKHTDNPEEELSGPSP